MNYMEQVAKMLGVEIGEEFDVIDENGCVIDWSPYRFSQSSLINNEGDRCTGCMVGLLYGTYKIKKKPWIPKIGEYYYRVLGNGDIGMIRNDENALRLSNKYNIKLGNCYRTGEEADNDKQKWIDFFSSTDRINWENTEN